MHVLTPTASFVTPSVPDISSSIHLSELLSGSQDIFNGSYLMSQSLFNNYPTNLHISGSVTISGSMNRAFAGDVFRPTGLVLSGAVYTSVNYITGPYTVDSNGIDNVLACNAWNASFTVTMPTVTHGRVITVKDFASVKGKTVQVNAGVDGAMFDVTKSNWQLTGSGQSVTFVGVKVTGSAYWLAQNGLAHN